MSTAWLGTFATNGVTLTLGMATGILAARLLLPEGRGVLAAITFWPGLLWSLALVSFGDTVAYRISRSEAGDQPTIVSTALCLGLVVGALAATVAAALVPHLLGPTRADFWGIAQAFALTHVILWTANTILLAVDQGRLRFLRYNLFKMMQPILYLCGLLALWAADALSVGGALAAFWLGTLVVLVTRAWSAAGELRARPSLTEGRRLLDLNLRFQGTSLAYLLGSHLDRLLLMLLWDDAAIGLYIVALNWAHAGVSGVTLSFQTVMFPHVAAEADPQRQRALLARGLRYACLLLALGTGGLLLVTPWLLPLLFGASFTPAVPIALLLVVAHLPLALRQIVIRSLRGFGEARPGTVAEVVGIVAFLIAAWPLIRGFDLLGISGAFLVGNLASLVYLALYLRHRFGLGPREWWGVDLRTTREVGALALDHARALWHRRAVAGGRARGREPSCRK